MAQRFGRNKRRRARTQIASLQHELQGLQERQQVLQQALHREGELLKTVTEEKHALSEAMREARHILGDSIALPAQQSRDRPPPDETSFNTYETRPVDFSEFCRATQSESTTFQLARMHLLLTRVQQDSSTAGMHCRVQLAEGVWVYAISERALSTLSPEMLERRLLPEISRQFARLIAPHIAKRRGWPRW